jgi:hypothetical protein
MRMLATIPDWIACGSRNDECWSYGVFLAVTTNDKGRTGSDSMKVWKAFSDEGCLTEDLRA